MGWNGWEMREIGWGEGGGGEGFGWENGVSGFLFSGLLSEVGRKKEGRAKIYSDRPYGVGSYDGIGYTCQQTVYPMPSVPMQEPTP